MIQCLHCGREIGDAVSITACGPGFFGSRASRDQGWRGGTYCSWACLAGRPLRRCPACEASTPYAVSIDTGAPHCMSCDHPLGLEPDSPDP